MTYFDPNHEKFDDERKVHVNQSNDGNGGTIALAVAAIVLVAGALLYFLSSSGPGTVGPQMTQNNTALPAPVIDEPAAPKPATPPVAPLVTPPVDAPATNP